MMNKILLIANQMKLTDWGMIFLGAKGIPVGRLSAPEVSDFACDKLAHSDGIKDVLLTAISEVAFCTEINDEVIKYLEFICEEENVNLNLSRRKWRYLTLFCMMEKLPDDCVYGLLELNEFWQLWGESSNSPNIIQGVDNNITPTEYYTDEKYKLVIKKHQEWLKKEKTELLNN